MRKQCDPVSCDGSSIIIIYIINELLNIRQYFGRGLPAAIGLSTTPLSYECNPLPLEYNLINVIKCRFNEMPSSANNTIQYKGRGLLISSLMYHSAPAICRVPFFCNMMQKIFLSSISANRKTAGGENQWNFSRKSLYYKQGQFALESNDIMTACKIQMTSSRFQNIKAILPAHIKMQKSQPNTSDLVFFKALISTERWRHFFINK